MNISSFFRKKGKPSTKRGVPLKRVIPVWRGFGGIVAFFTFILLGLISAGIWSWNNGIITRAFDQTKWNLIAFSGAMGFTAEDVLVVGLEGLAVHERVRVAAVFGELPLDQRHLWVGVRGRV